MASRLFGQVACLLTLTTTIVAQTPAPPRESEEVLRARAEDIRQGIARSRERVAELSRASGVEADSSKAFNAFINVDLKTATGPERERALNAMRIFEEFASIRSQEGALQRTEQELRGRQQATSTQAPPPAVTAAEAGRLLSAANVAGSIGSRVAANGPMSPESISTVQEFIDDFAKKNGFSTDPATLQLQAAAAEAFLPTDPEERRRALTLQVFSGLVQRFQEKLKQQNAAGPRSASPSTTVPPIRFPINPGRQESFRTRTGLTLPGGSVIDLVQQPQYAHHAAFSGPALTLVQAEDVDEIDQEVRGDGQGGGGGQGAPLLALAVRGLAAMLEAAVQRTEPSASGAVQLFITSLGVSSGQAFEMQAFNGGRSPVRLKAAGLVVEPLSQEAQKRARAELQKLAGRAATKFNVNAYCLERLKLPPVAGQMFRVASSDLQQQFAPARHILAASKMLNDRGALRPDSSPAGYFHSIRQWAVWAREQNMDRGGFARAFTDYTKKNVQTAGRSWTREMEGALTAGIPNRWSDVSSILAEAERIAKGGAR